MKIFSVLGSPNKKGNTAALLERYLKGVEENHSDIEITNIFLQEKDIKPCKGCHYCKHINVNNCAIKDDMTELYKKLDSSNVIILSTPVYSFNMTAQLKAFVDRFYAVEYKKWAGKKMVLLTTYGDEDEKSSGVINIINCIKDISRYLKIDFTQKYGVSTAITSVSQNKKALNEVYEIGKKLQD